MKSVSMNEARELLADTHWKDVRFVSYEHGAVVLALKNFQTVKIRVAHNEMKELLDFLARKETKPEGGEPSGEGR